MTTGRINQITLMRAPACLKTRPVRQGMGQHGPPDPSQGGELKNRCFTLHWLDRSVRNQAYQCKSFATVFLSHGNKASRLLFWNLGSHRALQAALILLPFHCTDPKQRVNSRIQLSRLQTNRTAVFTPRDSICSTNPRWQDASSGSPVLDAFN